MSDARLLKRFDGGFGTILCYGLELHTQTIHAITQPSACRPIIKDVTEVAATIWAYYLYTYHTLRNIPFFCNRLI